MRPLNNYEKLEQAFGRPAEKLKARRRDGFMLDLAHYEHDGRCHFTLNFILPDGKVFSTCWFHADEGKGGRPRYERDLDIEHIKEYFK